MTIKQLKEIINAIPPDQDDFLVIKSSDDEGNGFKELFDFSLNDNAVFPEQYYSTYNGETAWYDSEEYESYEEWLEECVDETMKPCIVLW
jgi:hypothetical protein